MILINGVETDHIAVNDRGFQYGDGLFETIEIVDGKPVFLEQHLLRLSTDCCKLNIPKPYIKQLTDEIHHICKDSKQAVVKIIITRGVGGRGYRQPEAIQPTRVVSLHPFPEYPKSHSEQGINARFCNTRLGLNPALAGVKHLNRLEQIMARAEWDDPTIQEGIISDINDHVIEGTMTNIFYVKDSIIYTATLTLSGVSGVMRGIIKALIAEHKLTLIEHDYHKDVLLAADEVFVCNAIIGIWPIRQIENVSFTVGNVTSQLQTWLVHSKEQVCVDAT
ncbi:aminodeoxychorismate lyase [Methyloglobulus sp.]|uniref:aminodeoxychorismate lyase n=1 Tax=Methyloglobulus sp. TaxID=2518622 RepID=UPI0032B862DB